MFRRPRSSLSLSAEQVRLAVAVLIHDGKIAADDLRKALKRHRRLVRELKSRLAVLAEGGMVAGNHFTKSVARVGRPAEGALRPARKRSRRTISATTRKMYETQGRYMAALRQLPKTTRRQIKAIRKKDGVKAAITAAKKLAR